MKSAARSFTLLLMVVVMSLAASAQSQESSTVIKVNIPFDFVVGGQTFPAGQYSIGQPMQHFIVLRDARNQAVASAFTHSVVALNPAELPKLRFEVSGNHHLLSEIWQRGDSSGEQLARAKRSSGSTQVAETKTPPAGQP